MLTQKERQILNEAFSEQSLEELTPKQAAEIACRTDVSLRAVECFALEKGHVPLRYRRNIGVLGISGQKKLLEQKAVISGLGGLGGCVLEELGRLGLGRIVGVDPDVFDETNLNRQLLADETNLGSKKIDEAQSRLERINRAVEFIGWAALIDKVPGEVFDEAGVVFDCLDNVPSRLLLSKRCSAQNIPLVHGAVAGWYGQMAVVWPGSGSVEKIYQHHGKSIDQDLGTPPFTVAVAASLMVAAGIQILIGKTSVAEGRMVFFDLCENEWQTITLK